MLAATHIIFGVGCSMITAHLLRLPVDQTIVVTAAGAIGSLLPDIDHPSSTFGRKIKPISNIIGYIFGHRGITHSLVAVAVLATLLADHAHVPNWGLGLVVGYLSHLLGDWLTPFGIPLFWPSKVMCRAPVCFRTGGSMEKFVGFGVIVFGIWLAL